MSKAFTKESEAGLDSDDDSSESAEQPLPGGNKNYMTPGGAARMRDELHRLLHEDRPEVVRVVSWAASNGDRSENGDYIYGKRRLREIDRRIRFLQKRLERAEIVDPLQQSGDRVLFGATVELVGEDGAVRRYSIVGIDETDIPKGRISWISPIGRALLNQSEGDSVVVATPKGEEEFEIRSVKFLALN
jgi:transcription elongation factor GreB